MSLIGPPTMRANIFLWCAGAAWAVLPIGSGQLTLPSGVVQTVIEHDSRPDWIALPSSGQVRVPYGVRVQAMHAVVIVRDSPREAALVGALRNVGAGLQHVRLTLHYVGPDGSRLGDVGENMAGVSTVASGSLLPFRFRLLAQTDLPTYAALYRLVLDTDLPKHNRPLMGARVDIEKTRSLGRGLGLLASGTLRLDSDGGQLSPADIIITLMLLDEHGRVLDVLADRPFRLSGGREANDRGRFTMRGIMPIEKPVRDVKVWVETRHDP